MIIYDTTEGVSAKFTATIVDESNTAISYRLLNSITLTLTDKYTGEVINSRDEQDVLNVNDVTISANGELVWDVQPEDNEIVGTGKVEDHEALFEWSWDDARIGKKKIQIRVTRA